MKNGKDENLTKNTVTFKITKDEYVNLLSDTISKKQYDATLFLINNRFHYIMRTVCTKLGWYDYSNGHDEHNGYFEPKYYEIDDDIYFDGHYKMSDPYSAIPIRWLWENFEEEFEKAVEDHKVNGANKKETEKQKREELKVKKIEMRKVISAKLTKEELKFIEFK